MATRIALLLSLLPMLVLGVACSAPMRQAAAPGPLQITANEGKGAGSVVLFERRSELLSDFWGREMKIQAGVVLPPGHSARKRWAFCYSIHGFGGSHKSAWRSGPKLIKKMKDGYPAMIYVYLNAQFPMGHHEFADSVNNGPWGRALVEEFIPSLEKEFAKGTKPKDRFLTGHSSGGWSSLWLQVNHPAFFNGTWSTAPDPVDFRDFTGINIYDWKNAYEDPDGKDIQLVRAKGRWVMTIREFARKEAAEREYGGQWYSFDAVFSARGEDGRPMKMHDHESGAIHKAVVERWKQYDISLILRKNWKKLAPKLKGKLNVYVGTLDTFRLEGAVRLLKAELQKLKSDATILLVKGRSHGSLYSKHAKHWPQGMMHRIHHEMYKRFKD